MSSGIIKNIVKKAVLSLLPKGLVVYAGNGSEDTVYLTFDDGPSGEFTPKVLNALAAKNVKATFFLSGTAVREHPEIVRRICSEGHAVGNHFYAHVRFPHYSAIKPVGDILKTDTMIKSIVDRAVNDIRPPYGTITLPVLIYSLLARKRIVLWSFESMDSFLEEDKDLIENLERIKAGDILLFHDDTAITVRNLTEILDTIIQRGFSFKTLHDLT